MAQLAIVLQQLTKPKRRRLHSLQGALARLLTPDRSVAECGAKDIQ